MLKKIANSFIQFFEGQAIITFVGFISTYFFAKLLGPQDYGTWQTAKLFIDYSLIFMLGLPFVLRRDYIQLINSGKEAEARDLANVIFTYTAIASFVYSAILLFSGCFLVNDSKLSQSLICVSFIVLLQILSSFGDMVCKGLNKFKIIKHGKIVVSAFTLLAVFFVWKFSFHGLLFGIALSELLLCVYYYFTIPIPFAFHWDFSLLARLIPIGFPIYLQNIVQIVFTSIDRLIIASFLTFQDVGYYSLSSMITFPVTLLVSTLSVVVFTELNEKFGNCVSPSVVRMHMDIPQNFVITILSPIIGALVIALPYITQWLLPKYIEGVVPAQLLIFAILFLTLASFSSNALFIINKQKVAAISFAFSGIIKLAGSILFIKLGYGIVSAAIVTIFAYYLYDVLMIYMVKKHVNQPFSLYETISRNYPIIYCLAAFLIAMLISGLAVGNAYSLKGLSTVLTIYVIALIPYAFYAKKRIALLMKPMTDC
jgi:O-antigen/teichoic acid export membrane protein